MEEWNRYKAKELMEMERFCRQHRKGSTNVNRHCTCCHCRDKHGHKGHSRKKHHDHKCHCCFDHHDHKWDCCKKHDHKCDCSKRHKDKKRKDKADLLDFEFFTFDPNVRVDNQMRLPQNMQTPVASITLDRVKAGDLVWLNGVFGLDQDETVFIDNRVDMRIFKGSPPVLTPGQEIYRARFEVEGEAGDDQVIEPLMHVDRIQENRNNLTYTVTIEPLDTDLFLNGPVTFTGALIDKSEV